MSNVILIILVLLAYVTISNEIFKNRWQVQLVTFVTLLIYHLITNRDHVVWTALLGYSGAEVILAWFNRRRYKKEIPSTGLDD